MKYWDPPVVVFFWCLYHAWNAEHHQGTCVLLGLTGSLRRLSQIPRQKPPYAPLAKIYRDLLIEGRSTCWKLYYLFAVLV